MSKDEAVREELTPEELALMAEFDSEASGGDGPRLCRIIRRLCAELQGAQRERDIARGYEAEKESWDIRSFVEALKESGNEGLSHEDGWTLMLTETAERMKRERDTAWHSGSQGMSDDYHRGWSEALDAVENVAPGLAPVDENRLDYFWNQLATLRARHPKPPAPPAAVEPMPRDPSTLYGTMMSRMDAETAAEKRSASVEPEVCRCEQYDKGLSALDAAVFMSTNHGLLYNQPPFKFCPWCGRPIAMKG